jgi:very-short-patch-repair endonuclease
MVDKNIEYYREIGRKGGLSCLKRYGREYFSKIAGRKKCGNAILRKYGKEHFKKLGKKSGELRLQKRGREFFKTISKIGIQKLKEKYGENVFSELGKRGAEAVFRKYKKEEIIKNLVKNSLSAKARYEFNGQKFRSKSELEVARILSKNGIPFQYEKQIGRYYPDFNLQNNVIIEVCNTFQKEYVTHILEKIKFFNEAGFLVIIYTNSRLAKEFRKNLPPLDNFYIITSLDKLNHLANMAVKACR